MENMMKKKLLIILTAVLLWVIPVAAIFSYSSLSVQAKEKDYELTVVNDEDVPLAGGIAHSFDIYMVYAGAMAGSLCALYVAGKIRSDRKREERDELEAANYMSNLF